MKGSKIEKIGSVGAWDILLVPETHPIVSGDVHNYDPLQPVLMQRALLEAVVAAKPLFTTETKYGMHPDSWNVLAVLAGVRKWFQEAATRINELKMGEAIERESIRNQWRDPQQVVSLMEDFLPSPVRLQITEEDVLSEYEFWEAPKRQVQEAILAYEEQKMAGLQAALMEMGKPSSEGDHRGRGVVQAMGGNNLTPKSQYSIPGTEEYGGAKPKPRSHP